MYVCVFAIVCVCVCVCVCAPHCFHCEVNFAEEHGVYLELSQLQEEWPGIGGNKEDVSAIEVQNMLE